MKPLIFLIGALGSLAHLATAEHLPDSSPSKNLAAANCPSCSQTVSRLAAMTGEPRCPANCQAVCCTGKTAHFTIAPLETTELVTKLAETFTTVDGVQVQKLCLVSRCIVLKYEPTKTTLPQLVKAIETSGATVTGQRLSYKITGMSCAGCSSTLSQTLASSRGVLSVEHLSHEDGTAVILVDPTKTNDQKIVSIINNSGYKLAKSTP